MKAKHNSYIYQFINDENYIIQKTGIITDKNGKQLGYLKKTEKKHRQKQYYYIKYKKKELKIHRIVYAKFIGNLIYNKVIHHIDGNSLNNHVDNLEQTTQQKNIYYAHN